MSVNIDLSIYKETEFDVAVVGGGPSGVCAAISAARLGVRTVLIEEGGFCGGMATRGLVGPFMTCYDSGGTTMLIRGLFEELVDRMVACGGGNEKEADGVTLRWVGAGWSQNDKATKIIDKWNALHPEIKVEYIELGTAVDEGYLTNLDTMIAGGEQVDVTYITYA